MPRKRPTKATSAPTPTPEPEFEDTGLTVGDILGQLPLAQPPQLARATFADEAEQLADPTVVADVQPGQGWATSHPHDIDQPPVPAFEDVTWPLDAQPTPAPQQVEDDYRPGDNEPPPGQRPIEQDPETADEVAAALNAQRKSVYDAQRRRMGGTDPQHTPKREKLGLPDAGLIGEIVPPGKVRYESRINIVDAFQYRGTLTGAPDWIDRNWAGFGEYDPVRQIDEGPCLRVPSSANPGEVVLARVGDYVCRQSVLLDNGRAPEIRTEVWASEQFERLFVGVDRANPSRGVRGITGPESNLGQGQRRTKPAA